MIKCSVCHTDFEKDRSHLATQIYRRYGVVVTVTGIPAVAHCPNCGNAILDWDVAQQVEELVQPLFNWSQVRTHTLPKPVVSITFPELQPTII